MAKDICDECREWSEEMRGCTAALYGECDCPKCQGLCWCYDDEEVNDDLPGLDNV
jgi:hypothetical protein